MSQSKKYKPLSTSHEVDNVCPHCGAKTDQTSGVDSEHGPEPGSPSICLYCAGICIFTDELKLRVPLEHELFEIYMLKGWPEYEAVINFIKSQCVK